ERLMHRAQRELAQHTLVAQFLLRRTADERDYFGRGNLRSVFHDDDELRIAEKLRAAFRLLPRGFVAGQASSEYDGLQSRAEALETLSPHRFADAGLRLGVARCGGKSNPATSRAVACFPAIRVGRFVQLATA